MLFSPLGPCPTRASFGCSGTPCRCLWVKYFFIDYRSVKGHTINWPWQANASFLGLSYSKFNRKSLSHQPNYTDMKLPAHSCSLPSALSSLLISRDAIGPCSTCPSSISSSSSSIDCMKESIRVSRIQMPHAHILGYHDTTLLVYILSHAVIKVYTTNASLFKCQCYSIYMATYPRVVLQCQNKFCVCVVTWS